MFKERTNNWPAKLLLILAALVIFISCKPVQNVKERERRDAILPTITSISPTAGPSSGGTIITIYGTDFGVSKNSVSIGGSACVGLTIINSTTLRCTTTAHSAGLASVSISNGAGESYTKDGLFTYVAPPSVTSISPSAGSTLGSTSVTISGSDFSNGANVTIDGTSCSGAIVVSSTSITCTTSAHSAGTFSVVITNSDGQTGMLTNAYTFQPAPTVTSVTPSSGFSSGSTPVTINGTGFLTGAAVNFGGSNCTGITVVDPNTITCSTSAHAAGAVTVTVTNPDTQSGSAASAFTYIPPPTVTAVQPTAGALAGGTTATITGTGFLTGATVDFGGSTCASPTVVNSTTLTCITSGHAAGAVNVAVTNSDTQSGTATNAYTYQAAPSIISITPTLGYAAGSTPVTITGSDFIIGASVSLGGSSCSPVTVVDPNTITCTTSAHAAGVVDLSVTNSDSQSVTLTNAYTYVPAPTVTSISPTSGYASGGTFVTITGSDFQNGVPLTVTIGGSSCAPVTFNSSTSLSCITAAGAAGTATVTVTNPDLQIGSTAGLYTYVPAPTVTSVSPNAGALTGATTVTVTGTGFITGATVDFGGSACTGPFVVNDTTITCSTPAGAGTVNVAVTNPDTQSGTALAAYTYQAAPTVSSILPASGFGNGGTTVAITGTGFVAGASVTVGGVACTSALVTGPTALSCVTSAHAGGVVDVVVTNADTQTGTGTGIYTYIAAPSISNISPTSGPTGGGTTVTVNGADFGLAASVSIDGVTCPTVNYISGTQLECVTPAHVAGTATVTVTNPDTQVAHLTAGFTFIPAPTVTGVSPTAGALAGGTTATVTGTGFLSGATVSFGGSSCASVNVINSTTLTCITTGHAAGATNILVTNTDTQNGTGVGLYTYQAAPTVTSVSASAGALAGGTFVSIDGADFLAGASVDFGGSACTGVTVVDPNTITCTTSAHAAGAVTVTVTNSDNQSGNAASAYTYQAAPTVSTVSPSAGALAGGTVVTITGTGFLSGATVSLGGSGCGSLTVVNPTTITCTTSGHAAGAVLVSVSNSDAQSGSLSNGFTYQAAPTVASVSPSAGALAGGTAVTITGTDFLSGATVDFGGSACSSVTVVSPSTITCTTSIHVAGAVTVTVTNPDYQSGNAATAYTYQPAPTVSGVLPTSGFASGSTGVTISGSGFVAGATVSFGGSACGTLTVVDPNTITCTTSAHAAGSVTVTVTNADTQSGSAASAYTYIAAPTVSSVSPTSGFATGLTAVTITGTGFTAGATVDFGGSACTGVTVVSATSITCTTAAHAAGAVTVSVTNTDSQNGSAASAFTYVDAPTVTSVTPASGFATGLTPVTITGTGFTAGATVDLGGSACTGVTVVGATSITCTTSAHAAGAVDVTVTNTDTQSGTALGAYTYVAAPTVTSISPTSGFATGLTPVTITGTGFTAGATVDLGGSACTGITVVSATSITCTTAAHTAGTVTVSVTNTDTQSGSAASAFTYVDAPTVTSVLPAAGALAGGTAVTITGTGFSGVTAVDFGGSACGGITTVNATTVTCTTSAHVAGLVTVTVTNGDTQTGSANNAFTYQAAPTVSSVLPAAGALAGGTFITITGTDFLSGAAVTVGGSSCTSVTVVNDTTITCTTSAHAAGASSIVVTNADLQTGTGVGLYTYQAAPSVTSVSPNAGALAGGTNITITGSGFLAGATVDVGGSACTAVNVASDTSITCTTPAHVAGAVTITVTNTDTQSGSLASAYTYQAAPTVSSVSPQMGALVGGTTVTITGTGFVTGATVDFGGSTCNSVVVVSAFNIICTTSAHAVGSVTVTVTNADGQSGSQAVAYSYVPAPTVTAVTPAAGALAGGTAVTITGTGFMSGATVLFSGSSCTGVTVVSDTSITCTTSTHSAGAVTVTVTNSDTQSGSGVGVYTYQPAPTVTSVSPTYGNPAGGALATITGTNFVAGASVTFGGSACTGVTVVSATSITCTTPAHANGTVDVVVTNADNQSGTLASAFTYPPAPTVSNVTPNVGGAGTTVTINGTGFLSGATVDFGGSACTGVTVVSPLNIICTVPAHADGAVTVTVTNPDGQSGFQGVAFIYLPAPTVTSVSQNAGALAGGTAVTITGTNFLAGATASFGGSSCTSLTVVNATTITCTTSAHAAGAVTVSVTNSDGQTGSAAAAYTYQAAPTVSSVSPNGGPLAGGNLITITGTGFLAGANATVGGLACAPLTVVNDTTITCTAPGHAAGLVSVVVTNSDTQSGTGTGLYTYSDAPTVTSISPTAGALAGGTAVTITGTGFLSGATVDLGGSTCSSVTVVSATSITCTSSAHAAGAVAVTVTNSDTQSGNAAGAYTYQAAPTVTSVSPATGLPAGGTAVTITGTGFLAGATVDFGGSSCAGVSIVSDTSITCTTTGHSAGAVTVSVSNTDAQVGSAASAYNYQSAAILGFVIGVASPTPPNPDDFGSTTTNITHTFTLTNTGDIATSAITMSKTGINPGAWMFGTDNCSGAGLNPGQTCTIQVTFLGAFLPTATYSATLQATATTGGTSTNAITGTHP